MHVKPDYRRKKFGPLRQKTLKNAVAHCIARQFPRIGGPRIQQLCAEMILEIVGRHLRPFDQLCHGQVLWTAIAIDDPPAKNNRIADTRLVAVILDLFTTEDLELILQRASRSRRLAQQAARLCRQAHAQGGLLSNCDLSALLGVSESYIANLLVAYERDNRQVLPRRATLHDVGTGLTHKAIICRKRYLDGKQPDEIARETYHSLEAVDRYLGMFDRVRQCLAHGLSPAEIASALDCTPALLQQYLDIHKEVEAARA
jgi:hypothetical protein